MSATHLAATYVNKSWADAARQPIIRTTRAQHTVAEAHTTRQCASMYTARTSYNCTVYIDGH